MDNRKIVLFDILSIYKNNLINFSDILFGVILGNRSVGRRVVVWTVTRFLGLSSRPSSRASSRASSRSLWCVLMLNHADHIKLNSP